VVRLCLLPLLEVVELGFLAAQQIFWLVRQAQEAVLLAL
jgi:hypothetical protein